MCSARGLMGPELRVVASPAWSGRIIMMIMRNKFMRIMMIIHEDHEDHIHHDDHNNQVDAVWSGMIIHDDHCDEKKK